MNTKIGKEIAKRRTENLLGFLDEIRMELEGNGDIRVDDTESRELMFFDIDNLPNDITPLCVPIMRDLKKNIFTGG